MCIGVRSSILGANIASDEDRRARPLLLHLDSELEQLDENVRAIRGLTAEDREAYEKLKEKQGQSKADVMDEIISKIEQATTQIKQQ
jgi:hypothetical protein